LNVIQTAKRSGLRIWSNAYNYYDAELDKQAEVNLTPTPSIIKAHEFQTSRLQELSLIVDTQGAYKGEDKS